MYGYGYNSILNKMDGVSYDADALAFIAAYSITDTTQKAAINTAVTSLKAGTLWGKGDVILPYVGGNATAHRGNLKNATNGVTWFGGITHNSSGVIFNGSTGYGDVAFALSAGNALDRSFAHSVKNNPAAQSGWSGNFNGSVVFGVQLNESGGFLIEGVGVNSLVNTTIYIPYGVVVNSITSNTSGKIYKNDGTLIYTNASVGSTPNSGNMFTGALSNSGSPILYNARTADFEYYGSGLTALEATELIGIINTFNTTLGR